MTVESKSHEHVCPLKAVHQRLEDLHRQWHQAEQAYFDPDAFRVAIQTAIQTARTVTFILQSNKSRIPHFETWYPQWQIKFSEIPLMRWMVNARNKIEKQGDLEAHSFIKAELLVSHLEEGPIIEFPAQLSDAPAKLLNSIPDTPVGSHIKKDGFLRIQRKWVENTLPDYELLDAVAITYGHLSMMVSDAHRQIGITEPTPIDENTGEEFDAVSMAGRMPCMIGHSDIRTMDLWLASGAIVDIDLVKKSIPITSAVDAGKRYEIDPKTIFGSSASPDDQLRSLFATARAMFLKDGYHVTILFLMKAGKPIESIVLEPEEHGEKYLMMRKIAHLVERKGADAVILLGEIWTAPYDKEHPYRRPLDAPTRHEALQGTLVAKTSSPKQLFAKITRANEQVELGMTEERDGGAQFMFAPIYKVWGKPIPEDWLKATDGVDTADRTV